MKGIKEKRKDISRQNRSAKKLNRVINQAFKYPSRFSTTWNATSETDVDTVLFRSKKKGETTKIVFRQKVSSKNPEDFVVRIQEVNPSNAGSEIIQIHPDGVVTSETVIRPGTEFEDSLQPRELTPREIRDLYKKLKKANTSKLYED